MNPLENPINSDIFEAYLLGQLSDEQVEALDECLANDPALLRRFAEAMHLMSLTRHEFAGQAQYQAANQQEPLLEDFNTLLQELGQFEAQAPTVTRAVQVPGEQSKSTKQKEAGSLSMHDFVSAGQYVLGKAIASKPAILGAAAAIVLLALIVINPFASNAPDAPEITDNTNTSEPTEPGRVGPGHTQPVATLTATHNAQWGSTPAERALARGSELKAGTRLTLTAGFAEITTNDGAVVILEAPATIELIHNNALRLHAGKLVGICETESSKGFLVRTPHMDVIDLGTRFGVDATAPGQTLVKVFEGEVEAALTAPVSEQPERKRLTSGHALAAQTGIGWTPAAYEPNRFVMDMTTDRLRPEFAGTNAVWLGRVSHDLEQDKQEADALQVFIEQRGLMLAQAVPTDFDSKQEWDPRLGVGQQRVEAGKRVDVYLLHYDLVAGHESPEEFVINFDRPILGVIGAQETLNATDASLGSPKASYPHFEVDRDTALGARGINPPGFGKHPHEEDIVSISADGTQLRLRLWGGTPEQVAERTAKMDQLRVIVQAVEAAP